MTTEIEQGRYGRKSTKPEQRRCKICKAEKNPDDGGRISFFREMSHVQDKRDIMLVSIYASFPNVKCLDLTLNGIHPPGGFPPLCQNVWHQRAETF